MNALGTLHVLMAARDLGVRRVEFAGPSSVYGDQDTLPLREQMTPNPLNPYVLQKLVGEKYAHLFHKLYGMQTLTLRYLAMDCEARLSPTFVLREILGLEWLGLRLRIFSVKVPTD